MNENFALFVKILTDAGSTEHAIRRLNRQLAVLRGRQAEARRATIAYKKSNTDANYQTRRAALLALRRARAIGAERRALLSLTAAENTHTAAKVKSTAATAAASSAMSRFAHSTHAANAAAASGIAMRMAIPMTALSIVSLRAAAQMESFGVSLQTVLKNADTAKDTLADFIQLANTTPFQTQEVVAAGKALLGYGVSASTAASTLRMLGDIASGVDAPLGRIANIYGKAKLLGKAQAEELRQFSENAIPIVPKLAQMLGVNENQVFQMGSKGLITFPLIQRAFREMTTGEGIFAGGSERLSQTLGGRWSTALGKWWEASASYGDFLNEQYEVKQSLIGLADAADSVTAYFKKGDTQMAKFITTTGVWTTAAAAGASVVALWGTEIGKMIFTRFIPLGAAIASLHSIIYSIDGILKNMGYSGLFGADRQNRARDDYTPQTAHGKRYDHLKKREGVLRTMLMRRDETGQFYYRAQPQGIVQRMWAELFDNELLNERSDIQQELAQNLTMQHRVIPDDGFNLSQELLKAAKGWQHNNLVARDVDGGFHKGEHILRLIIEEGTTGKQIFESVETWNPRENRESIVNVSGDARNTDLAIAGAG